MKIKIDNRFPDVPFYDDVEWLKTQLVKEEHLLWCCERWKKHDDKFESQAGGCGPGDQLDWNYHFSPKGLVISYALFHLFIWDDYFQNNDCDDVCWMDVTFSKSEIEQILNKQNQLSLF